MKDFLKRTFGRGASTSSHTQNASRAPREVAPIGHRFDGKVAVVTGASAGIGLETAIAFAREGAKVALIARRENEGAKALEKVQSVGTEGLFVRADVSDSTQVRDAFAKIAAHFGKLDVAFNNAGVMQKMGAVVNIDEAEFDRVMAVNVKGTWLCMREEIALMQKSGGAIVNMSSIRGNFPGANFGVYAASKAAVVAISKSAALDYAEKNIRVNVVGPGFVRTNMTRGVEDEWIKKRIPMGRWIEPEEIAETVLYLCSDAAQSITGEVVIIDGGVTMRAW